ncbi:hypothetical protein QUF58_01265 [Anaerolineales bacterium HSG24]|nr:hypothetical protein [Anaerolineales bacterium HSG24]
MAEESTPTRAENAPKASAQAQSGGTQQGELDRVRELILGSDSTTETSQAAPRMRKTEVDRLREILFGAQMQDYERRFIDIRREIERTMSDMRVIQDRVGEFEKNQAKQIEGLERQLRQSHDETKRELERLRNQETMVQQLANQSRQQDMLTQGLSKKGTEVTAALSKQERDLRSIRNTMNEQREQFERKLNTLKREARQGEDGLWAEIRRVADQLGDQKTDRKALSGMLMEIATRLETGSSVTGLLEGLSTQD